MQVRKYSVVKKCIALLLQVASVVVLVVSMFVLTSSFDRNMFKNGQIGEADYFQSDNFRKDATKELERLLYMIQLRSNFETNGVYNKGKIVDLKDYIERDYISGSNMNGLAYQMRDLLDWGNMGIEKETRVIVDTTGTETTVSALKEPFGTADGYAMADLYAKGMFDSPEHFLQMQDYLVRTIKALPEDINLYKEEVNKFKQSNTNLRFAINFNGVLYTNLDYLMKNYDANEMKSAVLENDIYLYINSATFAFESSFDGIESEMYHYIDSLKAFSNSKYVVYVYVDKELPANDSIRASYDNYQRVRPWFWTCVISAIASFMGLIISIVYLTIVAGYKDNKKEVHLNLFDKIYTEVALAILGLLACLLFYEDLVYYRTKFANNELFYNMIFVGVSTFILNAIVITGYLSILRRARAGTLKSNSVYSVITTPVKTAIGSKVITLRVVVRYSVAVIVFLGLSYMAFYRREPVCLVALAIAIIVAGTILVRESFLKKRVIDGASRIAGGDLDFQIDTTGLKSDNLVIAEIINTAGDGIKHSVDEQIKSEKLKADLITNVSHDIKTPLTSIINYVELLKREDISNEKVQGYIQVLEEKSFRLKHLTEDLVEASKISSGNIEITLMKINFNEMINQMAGEFVEKFEARGLSLRTTLPEHPVYINADGKRLWRVIDNLYNNVAKYALPDTRVYASLVEEEEYASFSIKNISAQALNISADELTERFIRGDISRSTEGSGLGLSIAQSLTKLQNGTFEIYLDGDLFKATVRFPLYKKIEETIEE